MGMTLRIICGAVGLAVLAGTGGLALKLPAMEQDASVLLAGYMGIGGILVGVYLLFYAITGQWRPNLAGRKKAR